jgi:hypothetical protein
VGDLDPEYRPSESTTNVLGRPCTGVFGGYLRGAIDEAM